MPQEILVPQRSNKRQGWFEYDPETDVFNLNGFKFSGDVFRFLGREENLGALFRLEKNRNGLIVLEEVSANTPINEVPVKRVKNIFGMFGSDR